jgi:hypothetical protein
MRRVRSSPVTHDEAPRIAANIGKLPDILGSDFTGDHDTVWDFTF